MKKWWYGVAFLTIITIFTCMALIIWPLKKINIFNFGAGSSLPGASNSSGVNVNKHYRASYAAPSVYSEKLKGPVFWGYLNLVDIVFFGPNHSSNSVIIEDLITARKNRYSINSFVPYGSKLTQIMRDRVVLEKQGERRDLRIYAHLDNAEDRKNFQGNGYQQVAQNEWLIIPNTLLYDNEKIENILAEADIACITDADGKQRYKLNNIQPGSVISHLGVKAGDTIKNVNGEEIKNIKDILLTYWKVRETPLITLNVERNRQPVTLAYRIVSDGSVKYNMENVLAAPNVMRLLANAQTTGN